jgi:hypothetical protein
MTPIMLICFVVAGLGTYEQKKHAHTHTRTHTYTHTHKQSALAYSQ